MKNVLKNAATAACVFLAIGSAFANPIVTVETINFDDNQLPVGWNFIRFSTPERNNFHIQNQRFEIGQVDTAAGIYRSFDPTGVSNLTVEWDANIANVYWGQGTGFSAFNDINNLSSNTLGLGISKVGFGDYQMRATAGWVDAAVDVVDGLREREDDLQAALLGSIQVIPDVVGAGRVLDDVSEVAVADPQLVGAQIFQRHVLEDHRRRRVGLDRGRDRRCAEHRHEKRGPKS